MKSGKKRKKAAKSSDEESQDSDSDAEYAVQFEKKIIIVQNHQCYRNYWQNNSLLRMELLLVSQCMIVSNEEVLLLRKTSPKGRWKH